MSARPRIVVRLVEAHPELNVELLALPPSQRAERLRALASIGLAIWRLGPSVLSPPERNQPDAAPPQTRGPGGAAKRFADRLHL